MEIVEAYLYVGTNRRADVSVIEKLLEFSEEELSHSWEQIQERLSSTLDGLHISLCDEDWLSIRAHVGDLRTQICEAYISIALCLQSSAGHRVQFRRLILPSDPLQGRCVFEYEEREVGEQAGELAQAIIASALSADRAPDIDTETPDPLNLKTKEFIRSAEQKVLPLDTEAIILAAGEADIPWCKLDRYPFERKPGDFRIRPNSPLRLGHGCYQHIIDGTFCVDRSWKFLHLLEDREKIMSLLSSCGVKTPARDSVSTNLNTVSRLRRSAAKIGFPVTVKPAKKTKGRAITCAVKNEKDLSPALDQVRNFTSRAWVEQHIEGKTYRLLVANNKFLGILAESNQNICSDVNNDIVHPSVIEQAIAVYRMIDVGMMVATCVTEDISKPLEVVGGAFVDLDVAPELDAFPGLDPELLHVAAGEFVEWVFPAGVDSRIPLIAVTGTNGKTTTSRIIQGILCSAGYSPGLACSDGIYIKDQQMLEAGDLSGINGHLHLLGHREIDCAVLETARGGVAKWGFGFDHCDIGVCLNVVEDHLMDSGIDTLEQMATLKRSIMERATTEIVLNADDEMSRQMPPFNQGQRISMTSTELSHDELKSSYPDCNCFAVLEEQDDRSYAVIYDQYIRIPVIAIDDIPAAYAGRARYNVSNILHACVACYLFGVAPSTIQSGLSSFQMNFESTPGRLNIFEGHPFKFILDYAHNPDGISKFCEFIAQIEVPGRRFVAFSASGYNDRQAIRGNAISLAGQFDYYFCFNFLGNIEKKFQHVPGVLKQALLDCGVPADKVQINETAMDALEEILKVAGEGDLVVFLSGRRGRDQIWKRITGNGKTKNT